jgi:hypothetical protein
MIVKVITDYVSFPASLQAQVCRAIRDLSNFDTIITKLIPHQLENPFQILSRLPSLFCKSFLEQ